MICGAVGRFHTHLKHVAQVIGKRGGVRGLSTVSGLILPQGPLFIADTNVSYDPDPEQLAEITLLAAAEVRRFGMTESRVDLALGFRDRGHAVGTENARGAGNSFDVGA